MSIRSFNNNDKIMWFGEHSWTNPSRLHIGAACCIHLKSSTSLYVCTAEHFCDKLMNILFILIALNLNKSYWMHHQPTHMYWFFTESSPLSLRDVIEGVPFCVWSSLHSTSVQILPSIPRMETPGTLGHRFDFNCNRPQCLHSRLSWVQCQQKGYPTEVRANILFLNTYTLFSD